MLEYLRSQLEAGNTMATIMSVGGNVQVALKVEIVAYDEVGIVARVKGMMGGMGEPKLFPWACIASLSWS